MESCTDVVVGRVASEDVGGVTGEGVVMGGVTCDDVVVGGVTEGGLGMTTGVTDRILDGGVVVGGGNSSARLTELTEDSFEFTVGDLCGETTGGDFRGENTTLRVCLGRG